MNAPNTSTTSTTRPIKPIRPMHFVGRPYPVCHNIQGKFTCQRKAMPVIDAKKPGLFF